MNKKNKIRVFFERVISPYFMYDVVRNYQLGYPDGWEDVEVETVDEGMTAVGYPCPECGSQGPHYVMRMTKLGGMRLHCMQCEKTWQATEGREQEPPSPPPTWGRA